MVSSSRLNERLSVPSPLRVRISFNHKRGVEVAYGGVGKWKGHGDSVAYFNVFSDGEGVVTSNDTGRCLR